MVFYGHLQVRCSHSGGSQPLRFRRQAATDGDAASATARGKVSIPMPTKDLEKQAVMPTFLTPWKVYLIKFLYSFLLDLFKLYQIMYVSHQIPVLADSSTCYISKVWSFAHLDNLVLPSCVGKKTLQLQALHLQLDEFILDHTWPTKDWRTKIRRKKKQIPLILHKNVPTV